MQGQVEMYTAGSTASTLTMQHAVFKGIYGLNDEEIYIWGGSSNNAPGATKAIILTGNGHDFEPMDVDSEAVINDLWGNHPDNLFAVGEHGLVLQKGHKGWRSVDVGISSNLNSIGGVSGKEVFAVGNGGTILRYGCDPSEEDTGMDTYDCQILLTESGIEFYGIWGASPSDLFIFSTVGVWRVTDEVNVDLIWPKTEPGSQNGIWGESIANVFSVGHDSDAGIVRVVRCNGNDCAKMEVDIPGVLWDVHGFSATDVYAVGYGPKGPGERQALAVHWDGYTWQDMHVGIDGWLKAIWGTSPNNIYAVSWTHEDKAEEAFGRLLHFDGNNWTIVADDYDTGLLGIHGSSSDNIYAVGRRDAARFNNDFPFGAVMHFNGIAWTNTTLQDERGFDGVWAVSESEVYIGASRWNTIDQRMEKEVLKIVNGEWDVLTCDVQDPIEALWGQEDDLLFAITREGSVLKYATSSQ
ncbi:MAG: hypothetical protein QNJ97_24805 [Myxococcota bacterium]|nr:hypothetical protein [Myxococcota bacterium]